VHDQERQCAGDQPGGTRRRRPRRVRRDGGLGRCRERRYRDLPDRRRRRGRHQARQDLGEFPHCARIDRQERRRNGRRGRARRRAQLRRPRRPLRLKSELDPSDAATHGTEIAQTKWDEESQPGERVPAHTMAPNAALKQVIKAKLAHPREPQWALPISDVRQAFRDLWTPAISGAPVSMRRIEVVTIPGADTPIPTRVYAPDRPEPCPIMLYFHGGGFVKGGIEESDAFCRNLARATQHLVLAIDYSLPAVHPFRAQ